MNYSKYHDVRVDNQFATDTLVPDVVQLQTLQDFTRWRSRAGDPVDEAAAGPAAAPNAPRPRAAAPAPVASTRRLLRKLDTLWASPRGVRTSAG